MLPSKAFWQMLYQGKDPKHDFKRKPQHVTGLQYQLQQILVSVSQMTPFFRSPPFFKTILLCQYSATASVISTLKLFFSITTTKAAIAGIFSTSTKRAATNLKRGQRRFLLLSLISSTHRPEYSRRVIVMCKDDFALSVLSNTQKKGSL